MYLKSVSIFAVLLVSFCSRAQTVEINTLSFEEVSDTRAYFQYTENVFPIISAHRGGARAGYPENCIATLEYTLSKTPAIFEIDARMTKDDQAVLLHDKTLERTTTGKGKLRDHTRNEIKKFRLKDTEGNITPYAIPTLEDAIVWSKGKTLINLDVKDVPLRTKAELVKKHNAFPHVIFTVHNADEARFFYDFDNRSMFSAFVKTKEALASYEEAGIPWENVLIAYVGAKSTKANKELYDLLHRRGVMIMVSAAPVYDKMEKRVDAYRKILEDGADVIETDRPAEVAEAIKMLYPEKSSKYNYWKTQKIKE
ncbi:glycerophosphodiester phosphodiesterase [Sinomicrobium pectinilyticum]|uniref:Glycerophosphodiester phosphodiesterase n=1 Tax=Sinomicrobium pectinilyticum TaxID=1084421 RepID=A0A3N0EHQ7_SINP1|nr:glycerophosphodiester phosphodiesterase family protein [Sinomicrobium pectinilyticum]RNL87209.1 glycerophosphodiester phosphodiesterase [Sinomicrobium pectinilyticum]